MAQETAAVGQLHPLDGRWPEHAQAVVQDDAQQRQRAEQDRGQHPPATQTIGSPRLQNDARFLELAIAFAQLLADNFGRGVQDEGQHEEHDRAEEQDAVQRAADGRLREFLGDVRR